MNVSALTVNASSVAQVTDLTRSDARLAPVPHARAGHLSGAALRSAAPAEQRAAVAAQFEAILVRQLLGQTMTKMLGSGSGEGAAASVYGDMLTDTLATQLSSGPGLGLGRIIEQQLTPRGLPAASAALSAEASAQADGSIQAHP
jgi:peptidoglycan hydrolase FlgJ